MIFASFLINMLQIIDEGLGGTTYFPKNIGKKEYFYVLQIFVVQIFE